MKFTRFRRFLFSDIYRQILADAVAKDDYLHLKDWLSRLNPKVYDIKEILNTPNKKGHTLLMCAQSVEVASLLLECGSDIKTVDIQKISSLTKSNAKNTISNIKLSAFLLERMRQGHETFDFRSYIVDKNVDVIKLWLENQEVLNPIVRKDSKNQVSKLLNVAIEKKALVVIKEIIKHLNKQKKIDFEDLDCYPATLAIYWNDNKMLAALIEAATHKDLLDNFKSSLEANEEKYPEIKPYLNQLREKYIELEKNNLQKILPASPIVNQEGVVLKLKKLSHKI